jgi:hypothetical protein
MGWLQAARANRITTRPAPTLPSVMRRGAVPERYEAKTASPARWSLYLLERARCLVES